MIDESHDLIRRTELRTLISKFLHRIIIRAEIVAAGDSLEEQTAFTTRLVAALVTASVLIDACIRNENCGKHSEDHATSTYYTLGTLGGRILEYSSDETRAIVLADATEVIDATRKFLRNNLVVLA